MVEKLPRIGFVIVALWVIVCMAPDWYSAMRPDPLVPRDFFADYASARNLMLGKPVYTPLEQSVKDYLGFDARTNFVYSGHPPPSVVLVLPFAKFDFVTAGFLWNGVSLALLLLSGVIVFRHLGWPLSSYTVLPAIALLMIWPPLWHHTLHGQQELILLALITVAWAAARLRHDGAAGILVGIAAAIKFFPALLLVYFALRRRWRAAISGLASFLAATVFAFLAVGKAAYVDYLALGRDELNRWYGNDSNASLTGFVMRVVGPAGLAQPLILLCEFATLCLLAAFAFRKKSDLDLEFSVAMAAMLLLSPITWSQYFVLLLLPLVLCCDRLAGMAGRGRHFAGLAAAWILLSFPQDGLRMYLGAQGVSWINAPASRLLLTNLNFLGLAGFFLLQAWCLWRACELRPMESSAGTEGFPFISQSRA